MSNLTGMLVRPEDSKDLSAMLRQWRRDHFRSVPSPGASQRLGAPVKYSQVVCLLDGDSGNIAEAKQAIVMQRRPPDTVLDLVLSGSMPVTADNTFELIVRGGRYSGAGHGNVPEYRVDMPFMASAAEFHRIAQLPDSVLVSLGTIHPEGTMLSTGVAGTGFDLGPLFRWRIEMRDPQERVELEVEFADWSNPQSYEVRRDLWVGTNRKLTYYNPLPSIRATSKQLHSSDAELVWQNDRWEIVALTPPDDGDVLLVEWRLARSPYPGIWEGRGVPWGFTTSVDRRAAVYDDGGVWTLRLPPYLDETETLISDAPLLDPPVDQNDNAMTVSLVWYQNRWNQTSTIYTAYKHGLYGWPAFRGYGYGGYGVYDGYDEYGYERDLYSRGSIGIVTWTGHEWVLVEHERRPFFFIETSSGGGY
jgi:hypothetical protein